MLSSKWFSLTFKKTIELQPLEWINLSWWLRSNGFDGGGRIWLHGRLWYLIWAKLENKKISPNMGSKVDWW